MFNHTLCSNRPVPDEERGGRMSMSADVEDTDIAPVSTPPHTLDLNGADQHHTHTGLRQVEVG